MAENRLLWFLRRNLNRLLARTPYKLVRFTKVAPPPFRIEEPSHD